MLSNSTLPPIERISKKTQCSIDKFLKFTRRQQETCTSHFCKKSPTHSDNTTLDQHICSTSLHQNFTFLYYTNRKIDALHQMLLISEQ